MDWEDIKGYLRVAAFIGAGYAGIIGFLWLGYHFPKTVGIILGGPILLLMIFGLPAVWYDDHRRWKEFKKKNGYDK